MTDWQAIIQRAAYTRFCKTGSLEPFHLKRLDLVALCRQVAPELGPLHLDMTVRLQARIPVPTIRDGMVVAVDEWT